MIDIAIIAVIGICAALGWKRGLIRTLSELAVITLALFLAAQISSLSAHWVVDQILRPATESAVEQQVDIVASSAYHTMQEKVESALDAIPNAFIRSHAQSLLGDLALPDQTGRDVLLEFCLRLTDSVLNTVVYNLVHAILYTLSFAVVTFALRIAVKALNLTFRLPGLRQINQAGGLLLGVAKGLLLVCLAVWILSRTGLLAPETVEGSYLLGLPERLWQLL